LPLLEEYGVPATFFLTTEGLDRPHWYWWDVLEQSLLLDRSRPPVLALVHAGVTREWATSTLDARRTAHHEIYPLLRASAPAVRDDLVRQLSAFASIDLEGLEARAMTGSEVREVAASRRASIGAHTVHHLALPLASPDDLHREVFESRATLERLLGVEVTAFAYPYGDVNAAAVAMASSAGYRHALTCQARRLGPAERPLRLPRLQVPDCEGEAFAGWLDQA
jgi:peptidoglycan/xylan/chitin deacetylase (PgdA/CDA1 family)